MTTPQPEFVPTSLELSGRRFRPLRHPALGAYQKLLSPKRKNSANKVCLIAPKSENILLVSLALSLLLLSFVITFM